MLEGLGLIEGEVEGSGDFVGFAVGLPDGSEEIVG